MPFDRLGVVSVIRSLAAAFILLCAAETRAYTVIFSETFGTYADSGCKHAFPTGWTRYNVDGRTPSRGADNPGVTWVTDAWLLNSDFGHGLEDCAAFSTSWYNPAGAADDWMVTPLIAIPTTQPKLTFRAVAYDSNYRDGYEVRWATTNSVAALLANPPLLTVAAENTAWTAREVDLSVLAGRSVYLAFRNNSVDKFLLAVDDVKVGSLPHHDGRIESVLRPHAELQRLATIAGTPLQFGAKVANNGTQALTNVTVTARVKVNGVVVYSVSSTPIASLAVGAKADVTMASYAVTQSGTVTVEFTVASAETDDDPSNNTMTSAAILATDNEQGRDDGASVQAIGVGVSTGGWFGTTYHLDRDAKVSAIRVYTTGSNPNLAGNQIVGEIRSLNGTTGKPDAQLAQTQPYVVPNPPVAGFVDLRFATALSLAAGDYYFGVIEAPHDANQDDSLDIGFAATIYHPGRNWAKFTPTAPDWTTIESLVPEWQRALMIRVLYAHGLGGGAPNSFRFDDQTGVALSAQIISAPVQIRSSNATENWTATGGQACASSGDACNCDVSAWGASGTVGNNQYLCAMHNSSALPATSTDTVVTVGGMEDTFTSTTVSPDTAPNGFSFADQTGVCLTSQITSAPVQITGIKAAATWTAGGGQACASSDNGCTCDVSGWDASGTVGNGQYLCARHTSSASFGAAVNTVVNVGGVSDTFSSTTLAADVTPDAFSFVDQTGVALSTQIISEPVQVTGINAVANWTAAGGQACASSANGCACDVSAWGASGTVGNNQYLCARHSSSANFASITNTVVVVGGMTDTFSSTTLAPVTAYNGFANRGSATVVLSGGGNCGFTTSRFIPASSVPTPVPAGLVFPQGLFDFTLGGGCAPGAAVTLTVTYPQPLPPDAQYWKYGPTASNAEPHWYVLPATIAGNTATFTITDGGLGDDDLAANGTIVDQGGPGVVVAPQAIPALDSAALAWLSALLGLFGWAATRRRTRG